MSKTTLHTMEYTLYTAGCLHKCTTNDKNDTVSLFVRNAIYTAMHTQYPKPVLVSLGNIVGSFGGVSSYIAVNDKLTMSQKIARYNVTRVISTCNNPKHDSSIFDISHTIPRVFGGNTTSDNLTLECRQCNRERSSNVSSIMFDVLQSYKLVIALPLSIIDELTN